MLQTENEIASICESGCNNGWFEYYGEPVACAECNDDLKKQLTKEK